MSIRLLNRPQLAKTIKRMNRQVQSPNVIVRDPKRGKWLSFRSPRRIVTTRRFEEVSARLDAIEAAVENEGLYAAGFLSYEAAPAFDPSFSVHADGVFPLLWFGLFERIEAFDRLPEIEPLPAAIPWRPSLTKEAYARSIDKIRSYICDGQTYQVNFTYRLRAKADVDPWRLFLGMAGDGQTPYAAFLDTGAWAVCSASPELFLQRCGERIESCPMKGTAARGLWYEDDLAKRDALKSSQKDRAENLMIVDMVRNDLGRVAMHGNVDVPALFEIQKFPTVWQMTSTVQTRTKASLGEIFKATFPPASITGAPKHRTMEIINELETSPRRIYTGTIGFAAPGGRAQFNVAIRTALIHREAGCAEYGVGGGIVWDSNPADEYRETRSKAKALKSLPPQFDLLETLFWSPENGYPLLEYHLKRLEQSAYYFGFNTDLKQVHKKLAEAATGLPAMAHRVRLLVSRKGRLLCEVTALRSGNMAFADLKIARTAIDKNNVFLYHKTTHRKMYEEALRERPECNDVLLFNESGEVTESTIANVAVERNGALYTPPVKCGLLPGTLRARMLEQQRIRERKLTVEEVLESANVYLLNAVRGIHKVCIER